MLAVHNDESVIRILLNAKADPDLQDRSGCTALMLAARHQESSVRLLLNAHASIDVQDHLGNTALHYKVDWHHKVDWQSQNCSYQVGLTQL